MAIVLNRLLVVGPTQAEVDINFDPNRYLIRGPSDTGKSYIRDCLWYLLGGDKTPKELPESEGYDQLRLEFSSEGKYYEFSRGITGGITTVNQIFFDENGLSTKKTLDVDSGELLVKLSGAEGKQLLRSKSKKGFVTAGDLRHWFLLSQPNVISEDPTSGSDFSTTQRIGAFNLFLSGNDDATVELSKKKSDVERITGQLNSAQDALTRAQAGLPDNVTRKDVQDALDRVENGLSALTNQYEARAFQLKKIRVSLSATTESLNIAISNQDHSASMIERFELLDQKYSSDLDRLGATNEGIAMFQVLPEVACALCGTPAEMQVNPANLKRSTQEQYRKALAAEVEKIRALRSGLAISVQSEYQRHNNFRILVNEHKAFLQQLEDMESEQLSATRIEFSADPKTLALRLSELSAQISLFDEVERAKAEIIRLTKAKVNQKIPLNRISGESPAIVAGYAKNLLHEWGFTNVETVLLDPQACDLIINNRARLGFGAGKRAIFLTAMTVAMLMHALAKGYPHLGFIVIDSPLKAYSDPANAESNDIPAATVKEKFYAWLSTWQGPGQILILENESINADTAKLLNPLQFSGINGIGRPGFYLRTIEKPITKLLK